MFWMSGRIQTRGAIFRIGLLIVGVAGCSETLWGASLKSNKPASGYNHDRWVTQPVDIKREFTAYVVSFDSDDDNDGDGNGDRWGIPEWVAYEIHKQASTTKHHSVPRPRDWITDEGLFKKKLCPTDVSYRYSLNFRQTHADCDSLSYDRGHMCMKQIASRLGDDADWNSHSLLNACPQHKILNQGIWKELEEDTMTWADKYGEVWVVCGPIFKDRKVTKWLGEEGEIKVAIPDAFFKIVIAEGVGATSQSEAEGANTTSQPTTDASCASQRPRVLAFIFPQEDPRYKKKPLDMKPFLTSVDEVEKQTGLDFLTILCDDVEESVESQPATVLWK